LLKIIKLLNLTEITGIYLVRSLGLIIFKGAYRDFIGIPVGQYAPAQCALDVSTHPRNKHIT
jgi:hypothetical protein